MSQLQINSDKISPKTPRTASKEVRRQQLINATIDSIAKHGVAGTTMTTVTRTAGLSIGLANFHFTSKQNMFEETLRFLAEEHRDHWKKSFKRNKQPKNIETEIGWNFIN